MTDERWEGDTTGAGISDGEAFAPPIRALLEEMARDDWNTEQPMAHLWPHIRRHATGDPELLVDQASMDGDVFVIDLSARDADRAEIHRRVYPLIETIAEPTTVIVEREESDAFIFDVTLALTPGQGPFPKGHGHLVRFRITHI